MDKWTTLPHKKETVNGYLLKCVYFDPYYYVDVYKNGEYIDNHHLKNDNTEWEILKQHYKKM